MSFFSAIDNFFKKIDADLAKALGEAQTWAPRIASDIALITPILTGVLTLVEGAPVATLVNGVITQVLSDVSAVNAVATTAGGSQATALSLLNSIKTNLSTLLSSADVKNSTLTAKLTDAITSVITEVDAMVAAL